MADDFGAENLEDGELWLPPDFFSMDEVQVPNNISNPVTNPLAYCSSSKPSCMEGFQRISSSTFAQRHPHNHGLCKSLPTLQRFNPAVRYGFSGVSGGGEQNPCDCGTGKSWTGCSTVQQLQRVNPVQSQVETFMAERARALLQRHQQNRFYLNRVSPRLGIGARGGTGVFLPRTSSDMVTTSKNHNPHFVGKGPPRVNKSHEFQLPPRKMLVSRRQEEYHGYAEVGMPNNGYY